jgi:uncharacterized protein
MAETTIPRARIDLPLNEIAAICRWHQVVELSVFGSVLRGDFCPNSDIDLLVVFEPDAPIGFIEFGRLEEELENLLGRKVDLVTKRSVRPELRDEILGSAQVLFAAA